MKNIINITNLINLKNLKKRANIRNILGVIIIAFILYALIAHISNYFQGGYKEASSLAKNDINMPQEKGIIEIWFFDEGGNTLVEVQMPYKGKYIHGQEIWITNNLRREGTSYQEGFTMTLAWPEGLGSELNWYSDRALEVAKDKIKRYEEENPADINRVYSFYPSGTIDMVIPYKDGVVAGKVIYYYESGNLLGEVIYKNGKRSGIATFYDEEGKVDRIEDYIDGIPSERYEAYLEIKESRGQ